MMKFENIQIQLVDTPPVTGKESRVWLNNVARNADLIAILVDLTNNPVQQVETTLQELENVGIVPISTDITEANIGKRQKKMLIIANKSDLENSGAGIKQLNAQYNARFPVISVSALEGTDIELLKSGIFKALEIIRVHTKSPGKKVDLTDPVILKTGSTVKEAAEEVHKDFKSKLKYAVVWGSGKFDGQRVSQDHVLKDDDIIELHI
jgi:ribosome-interacting GTPase 1